MFGTIAAIAGAKALDYAYNSYQANKANKASKNSAARQMGWEEYMSNTAVRRRMDDLKEAGINPILAGDLTATTPGGASYSAQQAAELNASDTINQYQEAKRIKKEIEVGNANINNLGQQAKLAEAMMGKATKEAGEVEKDHAAQRALWDMQTRTAAAQAARQELENDWIRNNPTLFGLVQMAPALSSAAQAFSSVTGAGRLGLDIARKPPEHNTSHQHTHYTNIYNK